MSNYYIKYIYGQQRLKYKIFQNFFINLMIVFEI